MKTKQWNKKKIMKGLIRSRLGIMEEGQGDWHEWWYKDTEKDCLNSY